MLTGYKDYKTFWRLFVITVSEYKASIITRSTLSKSARYKLIFSLAYGPRPGLNLDIRQYFIKFFIKTEIKTNRSRLATTDFNFNTS